MTGTLHDALHAWLAANGAALRDHLILSTVLLLILLAVSALPSVRSRTRFALILLGVAKFLIPATILTAPASRLLPDATALPSFSMNVTLFGDASPRSELFCILAAMWLAGAALVASRMIAMHLHARLTIRRATAASEREHETMADVVRHSMLRRPPLVARSSNGLPMTAGVLHPVVLMPSAAADRFDDDELKAVLAHELAHVERRHNLAAVVQNVATTLFWFDPALWLANLRLHVEAEKDCDERVLEIAPDRPTYLSAMLKASYGFIAPRPAGVSCMSTSQLKERMDNLMRHQKSETRSIPHWLALVAGAAVVLTTTAFVSASAPSSAPAAPAATEKKENITEPRVISKVNPAYPESAREKRVEGMIVIDATISDKGDVLGVSVAKGPDGDEGKALAEAAMAAVKQWKFEPAKNNGTPVELKYKVTINFKLDCNKPK
jgi:TonB family protein